MTNPIRRDSEEDLHILIPPTIMGVSIGNITQVRSHEILEEAGVTSHLITFRDGGVFRFLYRDDRRVLDLSGHHVCVAISPENRIILYSYESAKNNEQEGENQPRRR